MFILRKSSIITLTNIAFVKNLYITLKIKLFASKTLFKALFKYL